MLLHFSSFTIFANMCSLFRCSWFSFLSFPSTTTLKRFFVFWLHFPCVFVTKGWLNIDWVPQEKGQSWGCLLHALFNVMLCSWLCSLNSWITGNKCGWTAPDQCELAVVSALLDHSLQFVKFQLCVSVFGWRCRLKILWKSPMSPGFCDGFSH